MDTNRGLQQILADLSAAHSALRRSSTAFDTAMDGFDTAIAGMRDALDGIKAANHAQGEVMDAVIAATEKALHLFSTTDRH